MNSPYSGFFLRDALGDVPNQPPGGPWTESPDIICNGMMASADPSAFTSATGYQTDYGATLYVNASNFLYVRALNTTGGALTGRVWLYYVPNDLILWPHNWRGAGIMVAGQLVNYQDIAAAANDVGQPSLPFIWPTPPSQPNSNFLTVAWVENDPVEPPTSPAASLAPFASFDDLAQFVLTHPNIAMRATVDVAGASPRWSQTTNITAPATSSTLNIGVQCKNMPTDGQIAFSVPGPDQSIPPANYPLAQIENPNQIVTEPANWPPNAQSSITILYKQGATVPPPGASITAVMTLPGSDDLIGAQAYIF